MKNAILLTGGLGTRLQPFTSYVSKHLLNVGNKPIIDYPINTLKQMGIEHLTIVVGSSFSGQILDYVQDGSRYGLDINYCYQNAPKGIAHAINACQRYVSDEDEFAVLLGDNVFEKEINWFNTKAFDAHKAQIVVKSIPDPQRFGIIYCDSFGNIRGIEEKPKVLNTTYTNWVITGCYLFTQKYFEFFKNLTPSSRGEYEVVDIIRQYHQDGLLVANPYTAFWSDAGTHESIANVNNYFFRKEQGLLI